MHPKEDMQALLNDPLAFPLQPEPAPAAPIGNLLRTADALRLALELLDITLDVAEQGRGNRRTIARIREQVFALKGSL